MMSREPTITREKKARPRGAGAEQVVGARRLEAVDRAPRERVLEHEELPEDRAEDEEPDDDRAGDEGLRVDQDLQALAAGEPGVVARRPERGDGLADRVDRGGRRRGGGAHWSALPSRTRGLRIEYRMSAASVDRRNTTPTTSTAASSAGKSFWVAARKIIWPIPW